MFDITTLWKRKDPNDASAPIDDVFLGEIAANFGSFQSGEYPRKFTRVGVARVGLRTGIAIVAIRPLQPLRNRIGSDGSAKWNEPVHGELLGLEQGKLSLAKIQQKLSGLSSSLGPNHIFSANRTDRDFLMCELKVHTIPLGEMSSDDDLRDGIQVFLEQMRRHEWMLPKDSRPLVGEAYRWQPGKSVSAGLLALIIAIRSGRRSVATSFYLDVRSR